MTDLTPLPPTLPSAAARAAERWPDAPALIEGGRVWSFAGLYREVRRAAAAFLARGVGKGDVIALWAPNRSEWIVAALGAQAAGAIITPLNTRLKGREAADILRRSRARLLMGLRIALYVFTAGFSLAMGSLAIGMPPSVMFIALMSSGYGSGLVGNLSKLYLYRKGS